MKRRIKNRIKIKFRHKHPFLFYTLIAAVLSSTLAVVGVVGYINHVISKTPVITEKQLMSESTSNMYDINGNKIWSDTESRRDYVKFDQLPKTYIDLLLAVEDSEFYKEKGVSKKGVFNAFKTTILSKINPSIDARGGSTIDQQLLKNSSDELVNRSSYERKIMEWWRAYQMNDNFSKDQILEYYVNKIYLGEFSYGAETVSLTYFGKHLNELAEPTPENLSKLAIIAGLGQSPSKFNLYDNPEAVEKRRYEVLLSAVRKKILTEAQFKEILKINVKADLKERYWRNEEIKSKVKSYNAYVDSTLKQLSDIGYDYKKTPIQIYTYLDTAQQDWLTEQVNNPIYYANEGQQVAVTVVDPQTGVVLAQSGGKNEDAYGLNRATQQTRSSGSSTKPFISYGPAIEYFGYASNATFDSSNYVYPGTNIVASNYGGYTYGTVTMAYALQMSMNTPALRLLDQVLGSTYPKDFLSRLNMDVKDVYGGSDALGIDVSTEQEAAAFAAIANGGTYRKPTYIKSLTFSDGSTKEVEIESRRAMKESTAFILAKMLEQTMQPQASATEAKINEFAGHFAKTGTVGYGLDGVWRPEYSASDKWISGATKSVSISVWTGYDSPNEPGHWLEDQNKGYMYLYTTLMRHYNEGKDTSAFIQPQTVAGSGLALAPTDVTNQEDAFRPNFPVVNYDSNAYAWLTNKNDKFKVEQKHKVSRVPENFKENEWVNSLTEEQKAIYEQWKLNPDTELKLKDVVDTSTLYGN